MRIPRSFSQITVEEYQKIKPFVKEKDWTKVISIISGKSEEYIDNHLGAPKHYVPMVQRLSFLNKPIEHKTKSIFFKSGLLKRIKFSPSPNRYALIGWRLYKAAKQTSEINQGRYISIKMLLENNDPDMVMHDLAAITYVPLTWKGFKYNADNHSKIAERMKRASVAKAKSAVFFCLEVLQNWTLNTPDYLESENIIRERIKEIQDMIRGENTILTGHG